MSGDLAELVNDATPYVVTAVSAYGAAVLAHVQEEAANATVGLGRRLAQRIFGVRAPDEEIPPALADVVDDADNLGALRQAIHTALTANPELASDVRRLLAEPRGVPVVSDRANVVANSRVEGGVIQIGEVGGEFRIHRS